MDAGNPPYGGRLYAPRAVRLQVVGHGWYNVGLSPRGLRPCDSVGRRADFLCTVDGADYLCPVDGADYLCTSGGADNKIRASLRGSWVLFTQLQATRSLEIAGESMRLRA